MDTRNGTVVLLHWEQWRAYKLMTREALAEKSGVSVATILKIEHKSTMGARYSTIIKLATGLGISTDDLLYHLPPTVQISNNQ